MADVIDAGSAESFLVNRRRRQRVNLAGLASFHCIFVDFLGGAAGRRLHLAERD